MSKTQIIKAANITAHDSALSAIEMLITSHKEYKIIAEQERTKRQAIQAWKETRLAQIQSQKEILQNYLEYTFAERKLSISKMFDALDVAIQSNNLEMINVAIGSIVGIIQTSPLKQVDSLMVGLNDDNVKHIEF